MPTAKERLQHFLTLADQGPAQRPRLADELSDFLLDWPPECPPSMRGPVLTLLEMTVREADDATRARLAGRLGGHADLPLELVNEFYLCAPADIRRIILRRNETETGEPPPPAPGDADNLLTAARENSGAGFARHFANALHVPLYVAAAILEDTSGEALAAACKGTRIGRACYSALALTKLKDGASDEKRLGAFEAIPERAARRLTAYWQSQNGTM
jgi:hypothetical protein